MFQHRHPAGLVAQAWAAAAEATATFSQGSVGAALPSAAAPLAEQLRSAADHATGCFTPSSACSKGLQQQQQRRQLLGHLQPWSEQTILSVTCLRVPGRHFISCKPQPVPAHNPAQAAQLQDQTAQTVPTLHTTAAHTTLLSAGASGRGDTAAQLHIAKPQSTALVTSLYTVHTQASTRRINTVILSQTRVLLSGS